MGRFYKYILIIFALIFILFLSSCGGYKIEGLKYQKIEADHNLNDDNISSYLLIKSQLENNDSNQMIYNITFYSDFLRGTGRYYHYYQVDYKDLDDKIHQYYHVFDYSETERKYAQKFAPHEVINGISEVDVAIEYEFILDSVEPITNVLTYHEDIIKYNDIKDLNSSNDNLFEVILDKISEDNKYKFSINIIEEINSGHFDFQAFALTSDGKVFPFYGIYHYEVQRGDYSTLSYEEIDSSINISSFIYVIKYYKDNANNPSEIVFGKINNQ